MKNKLLFAVAFLISVAVLPNVRLPRIFGDNMVIQRNQIVPVWGWADPNEKVTVQFNNQKKTTKADKTGHWKISLDATAAGGPFQLMVKGKNSLTINNILVGEVWVCSGQSNMEFELRSSNKADEEIKNATYPEIRHFKVPHAVSAIPKEDLLGGDWKITSPESAGNFTAVGYFFAKELYNTLKIPIGLIHTSWGGTHSETWTSRKAFEGDEEFKEMIGTMPSVDLEEIARQRQAASIKKIETLQGAFKTAEEIEKWKDISFDDSRWHQMDLPSLWEARGLEDVDGVLWFRKTITLSEAEAGKEATIDLAQIDDSDDSYVNGTKVGSTKNRYNQKRRYKIPAGLLKAGANVIAVRVEDTGGGGGIYGDVNDFKVTIDGTSIPLQGDWRFFVESIVASSNTGINPNSYPTLLFNGMLNPLIPYAIRGVIWYQGESNAGRAYQYRKAFPLMITDWRNQWKQGDFPFYFVQLANYNADNGNSERGSSWAELREAQSMTLSLPNTGMAVITDIGEGADIHPKNKEDVGKRLAAIALNKLYEKPVVYSGPTYESMTVEGNKVIINFKNVGSGLRVKDKYGYLKGFEIAGADKKFYYAKASLEGNKVVVYQENITPVAVRYSWADNPEDANLYNNEGFPAAPFRTDSWKGITEDAKFTISK